MGLVSENQAMSIFVLASSLFCIILCFVDLMRKFRVSAAPFAALWRGNPPRITVIELLHRHCICIESIPHLVHCVKEAFGVRNLLANHLLALNFRAGANRCAILSGICSTPIILRASFNVLFLELHWTLRLIRIITCVRYFFIQYESLFQFFASASFGHLLVLPVLAAAERRPTFLHFNLTLALIHAKLLGKMRE